MKRVQKIPSLPTRPVDGHKGTFGTVLVVAGSAGMLGAAILTARGALRAGAGLVRVNLPADLRAPFTVAVPAATTQPRTTGVAETLNGVDTVVLGPGLGDSKPAGQLVRRLLRLCQVPVVVDADGLNSLAPLRRGLPTTARAVITPHPGEAGRLLGHTTAWVQMDRVAAVQALAQKCGKVVVLKGAGTLVCDGKSLYRNRSGNPGLATGGSGDVLAGVIGALLAQGMKPFAAALLGVNAHGKAGDRVARRLSQTGLCAEDLPLAVAEVLRP